MILTDANGKPFEPPEAPDIYASVEEKVAYLRAYAAYKDAIANAANRAFANQFNKSLKGRK